MAEEAGEGPSGHIKQELRPLHDIAEIFADLTKRGLATGLSGVVQRLASRELKVATMCSGTESPILALQMVRESLSASGLSLNFRHVFSAEIEAFKQAYIERNFHTDIIFRDIREIAACEEASTVYGGLARVPGPGAVDLLVAGYSCVDFSLLNKKQRLLDGTTKKQKQKPTRGAARTTKVRKRDVTNEDNATTAAKYPSDSAIKKTIAGYDSNMQRGESGDTLFAILSYAGKNRPPLVILENVNSAPWAEIMEEWNKIGYAAGYIKLDTKQFYIPHTRNRVYMLCIDSKSMLGNRADKAVEKWPEVVAQFKRPASSPVDAFLFDELDPRLHRAIAEINKIPSSMERGHKEVEWAKCQFRHMQFREANRLGNSRPFTNWVENGPSKWIDCGDRQYMKKQVDRIKDFMELYYLKAAALGYDPSYKARYPDISQNIDRTKVDGAWGVTGCITPSGMPFSTTRGGPIVGSEALALQGISVDKLHLTSETLSQLQNLAGNAMTSTVVGAAILSALIVAQEAIPLITSRSHDEASRQLLIELPNDVHLQKERLINFDTATPFAFSEMCEMAKLSARHCVCEGQDSTKSAQILVCTECSHTACRDCAGIPKHEYSSLSTTALRILPTKFFEMMKEALPMKLVLADELDFAFRNAQSTFNNKLESWTEYYLAAHQTLTDKFYFATSKRSEYWKFLYEGRCSRLELEFMDSRPQWFLYAKANRELPGNSKLRKLLEQPIARMTTDGKSILSGSWQVRLPMTLKFSVEFRGAGQRAKSWKSRLGLIESDPLSASISPLAVPSIWTVKVENEQQLQEWGVDIVGRYEFLPDCGTANGCLHKRRAKNGNHKYLFLDPERVGEPSLDQFVFSSSHRKLYYGEKRRIDAKIDSSWRPIVWPVLTTVMDSGPPTMTVKCTAFGRWIDFKTSLVAAPASDATFAVLSDEAAENICDTMNCTAPAITFMHCRTEADVSKAAWELVDHTTERRIFASSAWLTERTRHLEGISSRWRAVKMSKHDYLIACPKCAPAVPTIRWKASENTRKTPAAPSKKIDPLTVEPYEDPAEAIRYEKAMKARPHPIRTCVRHEGDIVNELKISLNIPALVHRALSKYSDSQQAVLVHWRLDTNCDFSKAAHLPAFVVPDNKEDAKLPHTFRGNKAVLRPEQQRSLSWMLKQETDSTSQFQESETEEICLPYLGWRAQARVTRASIARGGLLADKVGYGKTITTLALIDKTRGSSAPAINSRISLKATLVITPYLLMTQWHSEVKKFLGPGYNVLLIRSKLNLMKCTISDFIKADIIIVSYSMFTNPFLLQRISRFASLPDPPPSVQSRAYTEWLTNAKKRIERNMDHLMATPFPLHFERKLNQDLMDARSDPELQGRIPSKRYKGAAYQTHKPNFGKARSSVVKAATKPASTLLDDPFNLAKATSISSLKGPLFQMFHYRRIVIDEYTYASQKECDFILSLRASSRWILSGTPILGEFTDIKALAKLIGVCLEVDDDMGDTVKSTQKDRTAAETFRYLCQDPSQGWHEDRHTYAQNFLEIFARQNEPIVELPETYQFYKQCILSTTERARYIEMQVRLYGQEMQLRRGGGLSVDNTHVRKLFPEITSSRSSEEALLKSCSRLTLTPRNMISHRMGTRTPATNSRSKLLPLGRTDKFDASAEITQARTIQIRTQLIELGRALKIAERLKRRLGDHDTHYAAWKRHVLKNVYGDHEATKEIRTLIKTAVRVAIKIPKSEKIIGNKNIEKAVQKLRDQKVDLHKKAIKYVERKRMLRFFLSLHQVRKSASSKVFQQHCAHPPVRHITELHLLGRCGHIRCQACLNPSGTSGEICGINGCSGSALDFQIVPAKDLMAGDVNVTGPVYYGKKIEDIIQVIELIRISGGQILLFVQFVDMMETLAEAFKAREITFFIITGEARAAQREDRMMQDFKSGAKDAEGIPKVTILMLNASSSCAAGHNLTNANHVMFVSPLHESTQHGFNQSYEQAIGRARRFGQMADAIKVYYFLATKTIDVNLFEDRTGQKLVLDEDHWTGDFQLVDRNRQTESQLAQNHATLRFDDAGNVVMRDV